MGEQAQQTPKRGKRRRRILLAAAVVALPAALAGGYVTYVHWVERNFNVVVPGRVYRSGWPTPAKLRQWSGRFGIRSVINLAAGPGDDRYASVAAAAAELGLKVRYVRFRPTKRPLRQTLLRFIDVLATAEKPVLLHCRRGADRAGLAGVIAAMAVGGQSYAEARKHLSPRYLHFDYRSGSLHGICYDYEAHCRETGLPTGGWKEFRLWFQERYQPAD